MNRDAAETAARELRRRLGLGAAEPIDVLKSAQDLGALVVLKALQEGPQGMVGIRGDDAWVFVNTASATPPLHGRLRFTIAHEIGHWRLGHGGRIDMHIDLRARTGDEADANAFAAELLVPGIEVERLVGRRAHQRPDIDTIVDIAARFGVSCHVAMFRLDRCGMLTPAIKRRLNDELTQRVHLRGEHRQRQLEYADQLTLAFRDVSSSSALVLPRELMQRVESLWERGVLDDAEAAAHAHTTQAAFRRRMRQRGVEIAPRDIAADEWW